MGWTKASLVCAGIEDDRLFSAMKPGVSAIVCDIHDCCVPYHHCELGKIFGVIYQIRETGFHRVIQTPSRELKIRRAAEYF